MRCGLDAITSYFYRNVLQTPNITLMTRMWLAENFPYWTLVIKKKHLQSYKDQCLIDTCIINNSIKITHVGYIFALVPHGIVHCLSRTCTLVWSWVILKTRFWSWYCETYSDVVFLLICEYRYWQFKGYAECLWYCLPRMIPFIICDFMCAVLGGWSGMA